MKTVIITGATSGIGFEAALLFANNNYKVMGLGRNLDKGPSHPNIHLEQVDLLSKESINTFITNFTTNHNELSGIIHNAGIVIRKPFVDFTEEEILKEFQTHVFSTIQLNQALYPLLKDTKDASIVFVNSTLATKPISNTSIYSAAKSAQASLVKSLAIEWAPIRVNGIHLGIIDTPIHNFNSKQKEDADQLQTLKRVGTSSEAAKEIFHLFHSQWTTGALNTFDGGISLN
ncbi:MAG: SDR family oxidoreductase [Bdellovibrionales bacterium]|nr:SDR family oxidoreductase [Bdellovibrionales bacterium]